MLHKFPLFISVKSMLFTDFKLNFSKLICKIISNVQYSFPFYSPIMTEHVKDSKNNNQIEMNCCIKSDIIYYKEYINLASTEEDFLTKIGNDDKFQKDLFVIRNIFSVVRYLRTRTEG